jgi:hypothetical protein
MKNTGSEEKTPFLILLLRAGLPVPEIIALIRSLKTSPLFPPSSKGH